MKALRHKKILELIEEEIITTQEDMVERLNALGFSVTQATVSRDIKQLKLTKISDKGIVRYASGYSEADYAGGKYERVLKDGLISMTEAQNILVLHTVSGMAMAVAAAIDELAIDEIAGCIAGDDTVFCAIVTQSSTGAVFEKLTAICRA